VRAFIVSAACAGAAGSLLAMTMLNVTPGAFTLALSIQLLTAVVLGGLGSLAGAVWGGIILVLVPPFLSNFAPSSPVTPAAVAPVTALGRRWPAIRKRAGGQDAGPELTATKGVDKEGSR
jgi:ABC-type branched-subunit amino acid transport system permease subunit